MAVKIARFSLCVCVCGGGFEGLGGERGLFSIGR